MRLLHEDVASSSSQLRSCRHEIADKLRSWAKELERFGAKDILVVFAGRLNNALDLPFKTAERRRRERLRQENLSKALGFPFPCRKADRLFYQA